MVFTGDFSNHFPRGHSQIIALQIFLYFLVWQ